MREDNIALLKRGYEAFKNGDLDTIREMMAEDGVWRTGGYTPFKPEYKGFEAVTEYLTILVQLTDGTFKSEPISFLADDERVMVFAHVTATRLGRLLDTYCVHIYDIHDGKVFEVTEFLSEPSKMSFWE